MTGPEVQRAVLQFPLDGERVWLSFDSPRRTILANELGDVPAAMKAAERAAADGSWVVEQVIQRSDLDRADGVWMVNSVRGWVPISPVYAGSPR